MLPFFPAHSYLVLTVLCNAGCAKDIRTFLMFESTSSKFDVNLPKTCPLKPWQIALIVLASLHVLFSAINIVVCLSTSFSLPPSAHFAVQILKRRNAATRGRICFILLVRQRPQTFQSQFASDPSPPPPNMCRWLGGARASSIESVGLLLERRLAL